MWWWCCKESFIDIYFPAELSRAAGNAEEDRTLDRNIISSDEVLLDHKKCPYQSAIDYYHESSSGATNSINVKAVNCVTMYSGRLHCKAAFKLRSKWDYGTPFSLSNKVDLLRSNIMLLLLEHFFAPRAMTIFLWKVAQTLFERWNCTRFEKVVLL